MKYDGCHGTHLRSLNSVVHTPSTQDETSDFYLSILDSEATFQLFHPSSCGSRSPSWCCCTLCLLDLIQWKNNRAGQSGLRAIMTSGGEMLKQFDNQNVRTIKSWPMYCIRPSCLTCLSLEVVREGTRKNALFLCQHFFLVMSAIKLNKNIPGETWGGEEAINYVPIIQFCKN